MYVCVCVYIIIIYNIIISYNINVLIKKILFINYIIPYITYI